MLVLDTLRVLNTSHPPGNPGSNVLARTDDPSGSVSLCSEDRDAIHSTCAVMSALQRTDVRTKHNKLQTRQFCISHHLRRFLRRHLVAGGVHACVVASAPRLGHNFRSIRNKMGARTGASASRTRRIASSLYLLIGIGACGACAQTPMARPNCGPATTVRAIPPSHWLPKTFYPRSLWKFH